jgi:hypothetical protein
LIVRFDSQKLFLFVNHVAVSNRNDTVSTAHAEKKARIQAASNCFRFSGESAENQIVKKGCKRRVKAREFSAPACLDAVGR